MKNNFERLTILHLTLRSTFHLKPTLWYKLCRFPFSPFPSFYSFLYDSIVLVPFVIFVAFVG